MTAALDYATEINTLIGGHWLTVKDGDPRAAALYRRHYSYYQYADRRRGGGAGVDEVAR